MGLMALLHETRGIYRDDFSDMEIPVEREDCSDGICSIYAEKRVVVPEEVVPHRQYMPRVIIILMGDSSSRVEIKP